MQPKIQKRIQKQQPKQENKITPPIEPHQEMPEYQMEKVKIMPFDEITVGYLKDMQEQNNIYLGLRNQEEQFRVNLNMIHRAIHEIKRMKDGDLKFIFHPYLAGFKQLTPATKDEFLKVNINMYQSQENQYKAVHAQRLHRGDELGESRMRVLKRLWTILVTENGMDQQELFSMLDVNRDNPLVRPKEELPIEPLMRE